MTYNANTYCGLEFRISFENAELCKLQDLIVDWLQCRFPDGGYLVEKAVCNSAEVISFYDKFRRMWVVIIRKAVRDG